MRALASFLALLLTFAVTSAHADPVAPTAPAEPAAPAVDSTDSSLRSQRTAPSDNAATPAKDAPGPEVMRPLPSEPDLCLSGPCATV